MSVVIGLHIPTAASASFPTKCPTNTAHTIDASKTSIVDSIKSDVVSIKEETIPTGGHFQTTTLIVNALANTISSASISFPFSITGR